MKKSILFCLIFHTSYFIFCSGLSAQSQAARPGLIAIRITPAASSEIAAAFAKVRPALDPTFRHTDIHAAAIENDSVIRNLLGLPASLHGLRLRPYLPTHSVAFEDIRERSNPALFTGADRSYRADQTDRSDDMRSAEEELSRWFVLSYADSLSPEVVVQLARKSPVIELAEPRYLRLPLFTPNDSLLGQQYGLSLIHAFEAWDHVRCDSTMLIADDDVGTDWTHEDIASAIAINWGETGIDTNGIDKRANGVDDDGNGFIDDWHGWDFDGTYGDTPDNDPRSPNDHGTHTAGIVAAVGNNHKGIAGVAFGARILPIKTAPDNSAMLDFPFEGMIYAADMHAKAVNCSFGGYNYSQAEQDAVNYTYAKDCAVVAASGNDGQFIDVYPGAYQHVLGVGAVDASGQIGSYSDYNTHVAIEAPGTDVISTVPGNKYILETGTSMASPHACGVVGLVRQRFPWMTAGQAMQQVRATATPIQTDATHRDLIGHGLVNALQAVIDTNTFSARIESVGISDDLGLGHFVAGESGGIALSVRNYLKPVRQLWARLDIFEGAGAVILDSSTVSFGAAGENQVVENAQSALRLTVSNTVQANTKVTIKVTFLDTLAGYGPDIDYFSFIVSPNYLDLDTNNLTVTFSSRGTIGFNDPVADNQGAGFLWRNAPPAIGPLARRVLFNGGIMIGTDAQHLVDVVINQTDNSANQDLAGSETIHSVTPDHGAAQELVCSYSDSLADSATRVGIHVTQRAYAYTQGLAANAAIVQYVFRKQTGITDWPPSDSTAAAVYMDWDIGLGGALNVTRYDSLHSAAVTYRVEPNYPFVGMKVISALPAGASLNYHALRNDGTQGDISTYGGGFDKSGKWKAMTEFFSPAGPGDISMAMGLKNLPLASQDSVVMTVVFALAQSTDLLQNTIDTTAALWNGAPATVAPGAAIPVLDGLTVYPEPFRDALHVEWSGTNGPATVNIVDAIGRIVSSQQVRTTSCEFRSLNFVPGVYFVVVRLPGGALIERLVSCLP